MESFMLPTASIIICDFIRQALREDLGTGDITTDLSVDGDSLVRAEILCKQDYAVMCGADVAVLIFQEVDDRLKIQWVDGVYDGAMLNHEHHRYNEDNESSLRLLTVTGPARSILMAERVVLNILARMMGVATVARELVDAIGSHSCQLLDTRKTLPHWKVLDKYASRVGGARNHRYGLSDGVLIKENHIKACGGIDQAYKRIHDRCPVSLKIEVEVTNFEECQQAFDCGADMIMLDNMSLSQIVRCVDFIRGRVPLEASGNMTVDCMSQVAACGVDYISTSAMFRASPVDLSLMMSEPL